MVVGVGVRGFDKGSRPVLRTFDYRLVAGVGTFEFHPITDAILDWQLLKTWLPVIFNSCNNLPQLFKRWIARSTR